MTDARAAPIAIDASAFQSHFTVSPFLERLIRLQNIASVLLDALSDDQQQDLQTYSNFALVRRRRVVADVPRHVWKFDLACSLAAVLFAREQVEARESSVSAIQGVFEDLLTTLCADVYESWFEFAVRNARRPSMIAMPSLPCINLGENEERHYVQSITDTWPNKAVSTVEAGVLKVSPHASRHFVDGVIMGDLGGVEVSLSEHEKAFVSDHSVGWVSRYESLSRTVTIIEVDPWAKGEVLLNEEARRSAYDVVKVGEQRLDMYSLQMKMHEDESFNDNYILSRLLTIDQTRSAVQETAEDIDVRDYIHVQGSGHQGLGPVDEEVLLKSLGSITAKNKLRSALSLAAKVRLQQLRDRSKLVRDVIWSQVPNVRSRMLRCSVDGIYVRTRVPLDSILVLACSVTLSCLGAQELVNLEGVRSIGEAFALAVLLSLGVTLSYHNLSYKSWPISETVRLRRMCTCDEEMYHNMSKHEAIRTMAEAGAKGAQMDGILTCPFSNSKSGRFSVTRPLELEEAAKVGMKLRLSTSLRPLWVDLRGVRAVRERKGTWHAYGPYLDCACLELTASGPELIGDVIP